MKSRLTPGELFRTISVFAGALTAGALFLANVSSRDAACAQTPNGSWFYVEYCASQPVAAEETPDPMRPVEYASLD
jgi:hypothetical protein